MKFNKWTLGLAAVASLALFTPCKSNAAFVLLDGTTITNNNVAYYSGTNTSGVVTNNFQNGQVPGASNVMYQLSTTLNDQPFKGTNGFLPAVVLSMAGGYPGSLTGPAKNISVEVSGQLMATNASSTAVVFQFAATTSGKVWQTNYATIAYTVPVNTLQISGGIVLTNWDAGATGWIALQQINNPGVAALTNIVVELRNKPGL